MAIRQIHADEFPAISDLWLNASKQAHDFIHPTYWEDRLDDMVRVYLPLSKTYGIDNKEGKIIGFVSLVNNNYLAALFVDSSLQGLGIGSELMEFAKQQASSLKLKVYSKNIQARSFYKKHGFIEKDETIDEATEEKELEMEWSL